MKNLNSKVILSNIKLTSVSTLSLLVPIINALACIPLFIKYWGPSKFGEWLIIYALTQIGFLLIGSLTTSYSNDIANNREDNKVVKKIFNNYFFLLIINLIIVTFFYFIFFFNLYSFEKFNYLENSKYIFIYLFLTNFIDSISGFFLCHLRLISKYALFLLITLIYAFLKLIIIVILILLFNAQPESIAFYFFIFSIIYLTIILTNFFKIIPILQFKLVEIYELKLNFEKMFYRTLFAFRSKEKMNTEIFILSFLISPNVIVIFTTLMTMLNLIMQIQSKISEIFLDKISRQISIKKLDNILAVNKLYIKISVLILLFLICSLIFFGEDIYIIWLNEKIAFDKKLFNLLIISVSLNILIIIKTFILNVTNQLKQISIVQTTLTLLSFINTYLLVKQFGIYGIGFSFIVYSFIIFLYSIYMTKNLKINL